MNIIAIILTLLAPLPRPSVEPDITDAVLITHGWFTNQSTFI